MAVACAPGYKAAAGRSGRARSRSALGMRSAAPDRPRCWAPKSSSSHLSRRYAMDLRLTMVSETVGSTMHSLRTRPRLLCLRCRRQQAQMQQQIMRPPISSRTMMMMDTAPSNRNLTLSGLLMNSRLFLLHAQQYFSEGVCPQQNLFLEDSKRRGHSKTSSLPLRSLRRHASPQSTALRQIMETTIAAAMVARRLVIVCYSMDVLVWSSRSASHE